MQQLLINPQSTEPIYLGSFFPPLGNNQIRKHIKNFIEQNCGYSCLELWIGEGKRQASRCGNDLRGSGVEEDRE